MRSAGRAPCYNASGAERARSEGTVAVARRMRGEPVLACSRHDEAAAGSRIDEGQLDGTDLAGLMSRRNWNFAGRSAEICRLGWGN
jgi:hypothetical protein